MILNHWYIVLESKELKKNRPIGVLRLGKKLVLWKSKNGEINCLSDKCCHRGAQLSIGKIIDDNIQCPFHGLQYLGKSGQCIKLPANGISNPIHERFNVETYIVKEAYGFIWLWYGRKVNEYPPIPFFDDLKHGFSYSSFKDHWAVHYTRAVENQLDVIHLPFVHYNTIGRGNRTLVDGPLVKLENDEISVWVFNKKEDGSVPKKPEEITQPSYEPIVKFKFPHIWRLAPFPLLRIFLAFVPVDEENSILYLRVYQKIVRIPILREIIDFFSLRSGKKILRQDKRVVITQHPKKTKLKMGEQLVQGDLPLVIYRRRRMELKRNATPLNKKEIY
jgi:phenylpropionate dioxygenase-like ring-hydroxylating dioxygenase large terminal subunit